MNPELKKGDRIKLLYMKGESSVFGGECGTVTSVDKIFGDTQYGVDWDSGSKLSLISDIDAWVFEKKQIKENGLDKANFVYDNMDVFKFFNIRFLREYLLVIRESSVVNMYQSPPYLWMGKERIEHEFKYHDIHNEEAFEEMLNMSNRAQAEMINGVVKYLESKGIEENMENINKYLRRFSTKIVETYMKF
jgi:hypothetical protein